MLTASSERIPMAFDLRRYVGNASEASAAGTAFVFLRSEVILD